MFWANNESWTCRQRINACTCSWAPLWFIFLKEIQQLHVCRQQNMKKKERRESSSGICSAPSGMSRRYYGTCFLHRCWIPTAGLLGTQGRAGLGIGRMPPPHTLSPRPRPCCPGSRHFTNLLSGTSPYTTFWGKQYNILRFYDDTIKLWSFIFTCIISLFWWENLAQFLSAWCNHNPMMDTSFNSAMDFLVRLSRLQLWGSLQTRMAWEYPGSPLYFIGWEGGGGSPWFTGKNMPILNRDLFSMISA